MSKNQQKADELRDNNLGRATEEELRQLLGVRGDGLGGYGCGWYRVDDLSPEKI